MLALTDVETIAYAIAGVLVLVAVVSLARIVLKREERWLRIRVGLFIERDPIERERRDSEKPGWPE